MINRSLKEELTFQVTDGKELFYFDSGHFLFTDNLRIAYGFKNLRSAIHALDLAKTERSGCFIVKTELELKILEEITTEEILIQRRKNALTKLDASDKQVLGLSDD